MTKWKAIACLACLLWPVAQARAQNSSDFLANSLLENDISKKLPSVSELMVLAEQNSPLLKMYQADVVINELKTKLEQRDWIKYFYADADMHYGLFDNLIVSSQLGTDGYTTSSTEQTRYSVGVSVKVPVSAFANRKKSVQVAKTETEKAAYQKQVAIQELHDLVIVQYNNLIESFRLMVIANQTVETFRVQCIRAEKDFVEGIIPISEYARLQEMQSRAIENFETQKSAYSTAYMLLQETVGAKLNL